MSNRYLLIIFQLSLLINCAFAQLPVPRDIHKLQYQLGNSKADTSRVRILLDISRYDRSIATDKPAMTDSALVMASRAGNLAIKISYTRGIGLSDQIMAQAWCQKRDFKKSDELIRKAIAFFLAHNLYSDAAECYLNKEEFYLSAGSRDYKVMIAYYEQALPLFEKAGSTLRAAATLSVLGDFYQQLNDHDRSIEDLKRALVYYKAADYKSVQGLYDVLGNNYLALSNFQEGLKYALLAVKTAEAVHDTTMQLCAIYNHIGIFYYVSYQYARADYYYKKAIAIAEKYHDDSDIFLSSNLANSLNAENKEEAAIQTLKKCEKQFPDIKTDWRSYYDAVYLTSYFKLRKFAEAKIYCDRLLKVYSTYGKGGMVETNVLGSIIGYYIAIGQYEHAKKYMAAYQEDAKTVIFKRRFLLHIYYFNFQIDSARGKYYSAIRHYRNYALLKDSISEDTRNKQVQELQIQYETEKKEKENIFLRKESLLQTNKVKQADHIRDLTLTGIAILLVFVSLLYYSYHVNQKNARAINEKNYSLNRLVNEKEWLLKEIHHRVKNNLQIVMGLLQQQSAYIDNDEALAAIQNSENRMRSIALIHQKLYQSESLALICMPEYIDEMISHLKDSCDLGSRIFFEKQVDEIYLDVAQAVPLGLILNEAITNAIKYAYRQNEAGIIYVSLLNGEGELNRLTIADNGAGLPAGFNINKVESLGINLMKGLSKQLGGHFEITGGQGCTVSISFKTEIFNSAIAKAELTLT